MNKIKRIEQLCSAFQFSEHGKMNMLLIQLLQEELHSETTKILK